ncbi:hypothetical protein [Deinococcus petrolearius]|uniref:Uncharacterized protein n=1 Tax=Deinococcus petrolearius TaxID=1751295 RepID=A0ABW1DM98_9DEIO
MTRRIVLWVLGAVLLGAGVQAGAGGPLPGSWVASDTTSPPKGG